MKSWDERIKIHVLYRSGGLTEAKNALDKACQKREAMLLTSAKALSQKYYPIDDWNYKIDYCQRSRPNFDFIIFATRHYKKSLEHPGIHRDVWGRRRN
jgi:hypothetical protein